MRSVKGCYFARIDLRMNRENKKLYVLEVNSLPGL